MPKGKPVSSDIKSRMQQERARRITQRVAEAEKHVEESEKAMQTLQGRLKIENDAELAARQHASTLEHEARALFVAAQLQKQKASEARALEAEKMAELITIPAKEIIERDRKIAELYALHEAQKNEILELKANCEDALERIEAARLKEKAELQAHLMQLVSQMERFEEKNKQQAEENAALKAEMTKLQTVLKTEQEKVKALNQKKAEIERIKDLKDTIQTLKAENEKLRTELKSNKKPSYDPALFELNAILQEQIVEVVKLTHYIYNKLRREHAEIATTLITGQQKGPYGLPYPPVNTEILKMVQITEIETIKNRLAQIQGLTDNPIDALRMILENAEECIKILKEKAPIETITVGTELVSTVYRMNQEHQEALLLALSSQMSYPAATPGAYLFSTPTHPQADPTQNIPHDNSNEPPK